MEALPTSPYLFDAVGYAWTPSLWPNRTSICIQPNSC